MRYQNNGHSGVHMLRSRGIIFALSLRTWNLTDKSHTGCQSDLYLLCKYNKKSISLKMAERNNSSPLTVHIQKLVWSSAKVNCKICIQRVLKHKPFAWKFSFQHWTITITHHWWIRISRKYQNDPWTPWLKSPDSPVPDKMHRPALNLTCINGINKLQITSEIYFLKL